MNSLTASSLVSRSMSNYLVTAFITASLPVYGVGFGFVSERSSGDGRLLTEWRLGGYDRSSDDRILDFAASKKNEDIGRAVFDYPAKRVKVRVKKVTYLSGFNNVVGHEALL